jgi:hypothetical protein
MDKGKQSDDHQNFLRNIIQTINRQVVGLASTIAFYNLQQLLVNPKTKPLTVTVGGHQYTGSVEVLKRRYLLEKNYWNNYLETSPTEFEKKFLCNNKEESPPPSFEKIADSSPKIKGLSPISEKEEESDPEILKISGFSSNFSSENLFTSSEVEEDQIFAQNNTVLDKKLGKIDPWKPCLNDAVSPKWNDAVSHLHQKAPPKPLPNDVVSPTSTNDVVSSQVALFPPHMQSDAVSPLNDDGPRTLEGARKKQHDVVLMLRQDLDPTRPTNLTAPKWKTTAHKSAL